MQKNKQLDDDAVLLLIPRCRKADGGCGSTWLHRERHGTDPVRGGEVFKCSCMKCGRAFTMRLLPER